MSKILKIGTRGSPLALKQVEMTKAALAAVRPDLAVEVKVIKTSGDWRPEDGEVRLEETEGGKGQFAKEIEQALLAGEIDAAVHSMKDMESVLPDGLVINHMLLREDPRDALLVSDAIKESLTAQNDALSPPSSILHNSKAEGEGSSLVEGGGADFLMRLPQGATVGSASVRRQAFLLSLRPDLKVVPLRGNVATRIEKLKAGQVDATFLALAGLKRLGLEGEAASIIEPGVMLPAAGQGAVGIETREGDTQVQTIFDAVSDPETVSCVAAERAALLVLDGSCHTPVGAYAVLDEGEIHLRVCVARLDGTQKFEDEARGSAEEAKSLGTVLGQKLNAVIPPDILS